MISLFYFTLISFSSSLKNPDQNCRYNLIVCLDISKHIDASQIEDLKSATLDAINLSRRLNQNSFEDFQLLLYADKVKAVPKYVYSVDFNDDYTDFSFGFQRQYTDLCDKYKFFQKNFLEQITLINRPAYLHKCMEESLNHKKSGMKNVLSVVTTYISIFDYSDIKKARDNLLNDGFHIEAVTLDAVTANLFENLTDQDYIYSFDESMGEKQYSYNKIYEQSMCEAFDH
ncbi:hypothetical protein MHBO_000774 [Bonamia ostreae]|uniref:VWFA domain-containing protein n=1 Tax=Bonamia ostreae TaxID=126728 RepID=A0ABV2AHB1_9EUKA